MNDTLYPMIFKRKSFHLFRNTGNEKLSGTELAEIKEAWSFFESLYPEIKTAIRIVPAQKVNFKRDAEYCVMLYSEPKENYLMNIGYLGEQLDLFLVSRNIGTLWFGIGRPDESSIDGLDFVIMIAIRKISDEGLYRRDMFKAKRKSVEEIWSGETLGVAEIARFAPSACNSQPWIVRNEGDMLTVSRYKKPGLRGMMPAVMVSYYNRIDMGIFLCILEICLAEKQIAFSRKLFPDIGENSAEYKKVAEYRLLN